MVRPLRPCGVCDSCKEITAGNSLDVLEIDGASNNGVEQVRRDRVQLSGCAIKWKTEIARPGGLRLRRRRNRLARVGHDRKAYDQTKSEA